MTETQNTDFINEIKFELKYLGETQKYVVNGAKITKTRLTRLMNFKIPFKPDEILRIKTFLGI
jgi:hypothetical protein